MIRREFIMQLAASPLLGAFTAHAQQPRLPTIGVMVAATHASWVKWVATFVQRLRELGWIEGSNVLIEYRQAEGRREQFIGFANEFVRAHVDVILAPVTVAAVASKEVTSTIPIVFALVGDPVGAGLVASLARPGSNVTGASNQSADLGGKRLDLLREVVPTLRRLAILVNVGNPANVLESWGLAAAAQTLGLTVTMLEIRQGADIARRFEALAGDSDALYVVPDALLTANMTRINTFALVARLPTMHSAREHVDAGGLMSYGPSYPDQFRRAAEYVDKILRGAKPGDLPIEQPTKFDLVINFITARALGLTIPEAFLLRADEVIE